MSLPSPPQREFGLKNFDLVSQPGLMKALGDIEVAVTPQPLVEREPAKCPWELFQVVFLKLPEQSSN